MGKKAFVACLKEAEAKKKKKKKEPVMLGYDHNMDGDVSPLEAKCGKLVDHNHNGKIDAAEKKAFDACIKGGGKGHGHDVNGDKKVSKDELECGLQADHDHNGVIDKAEI